MIVSMTNSSCYPLRKLRITRLWEKAPIIGVSICVLILGVGILVLPIPLLLLSEVNQYQQSSGQTNNEETLEHSLVNIKIQVIIVAILMALRFQSTVFIIVSLSFVKVFVITLLVVVDEGCDPFSECSTGFRVYFSI